MSLLKTEPPAPVRSLDELFALARALEEEASARYADLAGRMRALDLPAVAEVFETLSIEERGHADQVEGWARATTGAAPDPALIRLHPPETFDEEEAGAIASSRLASAYRALSMAVRNEERAFALWTYIAAQAEEPAIQEAAECIAQEELRHAALLRRQRRHAFHAARRHPSAEAEPAPPRLPPIEEAARTERALAPLLAALAEGEAAGRAAALRHLSEEASGMVDAAVAASAAAAAEVAGPGARPRHVEGTPSADRDPAPEGLPGALRLAERAVESYLDAADMARDEDAMRRLQTLAERAIARIALLRRVAAGG